jgi:Uma2 family endonuclease
MEQSMSTMIEKPQASWHGVEMSAHEFLALPDDGIHRELVRGRIREDRELSEHGKRGSEVTVRNRFHSRIVIRVGQLLGNWMDLQPEPRGEVVGGEAGFLLTGTRESIVGIDVAVVGSDLIASTDPEQKLYHGPPLLAVEVLSPNDTHEEIAEMVSCYLHAGSVVWVIDPDLRTITVYRPTGDVEILAAHRELSGEDYLPGFKVSVSRLFE